MNLPVTSVERKARDLVNKGQWAEAISKLTKSDIEHPSELTYLRDLRIAAFPHLVNSERKSEHRVPHHDRADLFPYLNDEIPSVDAQKFDINVLSSAMKHHGALIVRNFVSPFFVADLKDGIEHTLSALDKYESHAADTQAWFDMPESLKKKYDKNRRALMRQSGSVWTMFSPVMVHKLIHLFDILGLKPLLRQYFGSDPCLSLNKWVLRKVKPLTSHADWHQDGSFMGEEIKSLNLWIPLTECGDGTNRPGMDLVPRRLTNVMETGKNGAYFDWSISQASVLEWFKDTPPVRPRFNAGDALFFDHFNLHATSYSEEFTDIRYAIETWFFAQDSYADNQSPVIW